MTEASPITNKRFRPFKLVKKLFASGGTKESPSTAVVESKKGKQRTKNRTGKGNNADPLTNEKSELQVSPLVQDNEAVNQTETIQGSGNIADESMNADSVPFAEVSSLEQFIDSMIGATPLDTANPPRGRWFKKENKDVPAVSVTAGPDETLQPTTVEVSMDQKNCPSKTISNDIVFPPALQRSKKSVEDKAQQSLVDEHSPEVKDGMVPPVSEETVNEDCNSTDANRQSNPPNLTPSACYPDVCCWK
jgi:hypothetical protein